MSLKIVLLGSLWILGLAFANTDSIVFKNFTSLDAALLDAQQYILAFNSTYNLPSLSFGFTIKGKPILKMVHGFSDLSNDILATPSTKYGIASISKTFTSALVASLVQKGQLKYDDLLSSHLPQAIYPAKKWAGIPVNITLRQLLSHMAGIPVSHFPDDLLKIQIAQNVTQTIRQFRDTPLIHKPGTQFDYSNDGFQLLGAVLESVTKTPFQNILTEFFKTNNLNSTFAANNSVLLKNICRYYSSNGNLKENIPSVPYDELFYLEGNWPSGGVISTVDDMLHFGQLMIDSYHGRPGAILSSRIVKEMWSRQTPILGNRVPGNLVLDYGLGWEIAGANPRLQHGHFVAHSGGLWGLTSMLIIWPEEEMVGVALTNKAGVFPLDLMVVYTAENVYHLVK